MYSAEDLADPRNLREHLVAEFQDSAEWRGRKAETYPNDHRNETSRVAPEAAAREVAHLPHDDPRLVYLADWWGLVAREVKQGNDEFGGAWKEEVSRVIGRHCFGRSATRTTDELLAALVDIFSEARSEHSDAEQ
jgi:hypothetical protein